MMEYMRALSEVFKKTYLEVAFPWAKYIIPRLSGHIQRQKHIENMKKMFEEIVNEHKVDFQPDSNPRVRQYCSKWMF